MIIAAETHSMVETQEKKLVTIASGKGGVGKTWLAITLSHALAALDNRIMLFDGDLGLANVDIQLGLTPRRDLGSVLSGSHKISEALTRYEAEGADKTGFDVLVGKSGSGALSMIAKERLIGLRQGLIQAASQYDFIILDMAAGVDSSVSTLANHQGMNLVVVTAEPTSLTDAYAYIKLRRMRDPQADIRIVVNQAVDRNEGNATFETLQKACASFLKFKPRLAGIIPMDANVRKSIRHQSSILNRFPQSPAALAVNNLAKNLIATARREV